MTLSSNWKVKIFTTSLVKSWSYQFLSLIDLKSIKKFIIASAKNFWPWRPGRLQSGREHFTWFWLYIWIMDRYAIVIRSLKRKTYPTSRPECSCWTPTEPLRQASSLCEGTSYCCCPCRFRTRTWTSLGVGTWLSKPPWNRRKSRTLL